MGQPRPSPPLFLVFSSKTPDCTLQSSKPQKSFSLLSELRLTSIFMNLLTLLSSNSKQLVLVIFSAYPTDSDMSLQDVIDEISICRPFYSSNLILRKGLIIIQNIQVTAYLLKVVNYIFIQIYPLMMQPALIFAFNMEFKRNKLLKTVKLTALGLTEQLGQLWPMCVWLAKQLTKTHKVGSSSQNNVIIQMRSPNNFIHSAVVVNQVVDGLIAAAYALIKLSSFTKRNQPKFILKNQQNMLNSNFQHLLQQPSISNNFLDSEPNRIAEDNLMNAGFSERGPSLQQTRQKYSVKESSGRYSKRSSIKADKQLKPIKPKNKQTFLSRLQALFQQGEEKEQRDSYVEALRKLKIDEEQRITNASKTMKKPKAHVNVGKGQQMIFDYQGNFGKRKESPMRDFDKINLQAIPTNPLKQPNSRHSKSPREKPIQVVIQSKPREKSQFHKLISSQEEQKQNAIRSIDKDDLINTFQIKHPGVKIMLDGKPINNEKTKLETSLGQSKLDPKTVMLKKVKQNIVQRFKTESVAQNEILLTNIKRQQTMIRRRVETEVSESHNSTSGKISIQNHSLHNFVVNQQQERDSRYLRIPSKLAHQRRLKTNTQKPSRKSEQSSKLKLKERLTSLRKEEERLPKILSQHYQIQAQVFKQFRDKCKQY